MSIDFNATVKITPEFSIKNIVEIIAQTDKSFKLIFKGNHYFVNKIVVGLFSRKVYDLLLGDPLVDYYIVPPIDGGDFGEVEQYFENKNVEITEKNALFLFLIGCDMKIDHFINRCPFYIPDIYFINNSNNILLMLYNSGSNLSNVVSILALNFDEIITSNNKNNIFKKMPIEFLDIILQSPVLKVEPINLYNFLQNIFSWKNNPNHRLAKHLSFGSMPEEDRRCYLNDPRVNINRLRVNLFTSTALVKGPDRDVLKMKTVSVPLTDSSGKDLNGIIRATKIPQLSASSIARPTNMQESYGPENLFKDDELHDSYFCTEPSENQWFMIDFQTDSASVTGYALKSWKGANNKVCPTSWIIEASLDEDNWLMLEKVKSNNDLAHNNAVVVRELPKSEFFRFFKFTQYSTGNPGNNVLALSAFDLFGEFCSNK